MLSPPRLLSLIATSAEKLPGKRIMLFSYGSGLASTQFSIKVAGDVTKIRDVTKVAERLAARTQVTAQAYTAMMDTRQQNHAKNNFTPTYPV